MKISTAIKKELMHPLLYLFNIVINTYIFFVFASIILTWLIHFNVVNRFKPFVQQLGMFLSRITEPAYSKIRKHMPLINGVDLSPIVLLIGLQVLQYTVNYYF